MAVRSSWFKWLMIGMILFVAAGGAHALADHAFAKAEPCATHQHEAALHEHSQHPDCCASCFNCPAGLLMEGDGGVVRRAAYRVRLMPGPASRLASLFLSPDPGPPKSARS